MSLLRRACYSGESGPFTIIPEMWKPTHMKKPAKIGVQFMGDLFHEDIGFHEIHRIFDIMWNAPQHTFLVLTKRPGRMLEYMTQKGINGMYGNEWPLSNIWLGVTAENQARADERIPILLQIPAAVHFVSIEPMLGPVDLTRIGGDQFGWGRIDALHGLHYIRANTTESGCEWDTRPIAKIDWVIAGGETGPGARPMHPDWVRSVGDQCQVAGVPFFFKAWGDLNPKTISFIQECVWAEAGWIENKRMKGGNVLDGRTWEEFPEVNP